MDTLGKRIRHIITVKGLTMTDFAKQLNISQSMVSKICADKATPSGRTIADICRIFCINEDWLLHGLGEMDLHDSIGTLCKATAKWPKETSQKFVTALMKIYNSCPREQWPEFEEALIEHMFMLLNNLLHSNCNGATQEDHYRIGYEAGWLFAQKFINSKNENIGGGDNGND